jgi:hypothetical protein
LRAAGQAALFPTRRIGMVKITVGAWREQAAGPMQVVSGPTGWLRWFLGCLDRAFDGAETILAGVLHKARFREAMAGEPLNERQRRVLNRLLDGFEGKLTSSKWAALTKTSPDTALRDISDLVTRRILVRDPSGGRSTSYSLATGDRGDAGATPVARPRP